MLRLKEHLQGRHAIISLDELAKLCDPEAWATVMALPDYFPKAKAKEQEGHHVYPARAGGTCEAGLVGIDPGAVPIYRPG